MIVDTHAHASPAWFEPVEALIHQMDHNDVQVALLVQIRGQYDNEYQSACVERFPDRLLSIVAVDPRADDSGRQLERLKQRGARGIRLWASWLDDASMRLWHAAASLRLPVSCNGSAGEFASAQFAALVQAVPTLPIILEHFGMSTERDRAGVPDDTRRTVHALSRFPNVYMRIHGLGEFAKRRMPVAEPFPFERPIPPLLREIYEAFGAERMMWGSNYPPVSALEGYRNSLRFTMEELGHLSQHEQSQIFGETAARVYGIR